MPPFNVRRVSYSSVLLCGLLLAGLVVRLPNLMTVPPITDEFKEVGWALGMIEKNTWPLVAFDAYDGPLFAYLLSFLFRLFGLSIFLPRLLVLAAAVLTLPAAYVFGRALGRGDRWVGFWTAFAVAFNAHHILFNSHVAWSNDMTPLWTTLALALYVAATRRDRPRLLVGAGLLYGLAVQTHPSALALAPGLALDFLLRAETRVWLRRPLPYVSVAAALAAYGPVLYYNLTSGLGSLANAEDATYAFETAPTLATAVANVTPFLDTVARVALGLFAPSGWSLAGMDVVVLAFWTILLGTLVVNSGPVLGLVRPGHSEAQRASFGFTGITQSRPNDLYTMEAEPLPLLVLFGAFLFFIITNRFYAVPDSARYFQPLMPVIYASAALAGLGVCRHIQTYSIGHVLRARAVQGVAIGIPILLAGISLFSLTRYYDEAYAAGRTNETLVQIVQTVRADRSGPVLVDYDLARLRTGRGGNVADGLAYLLRLDQRATQLVSVSDANAVSGLKGYMRSHPTAYLVSFTNAPEALGFEFDLVPLLTTKFPCPSCPVPNEFTLFRWEE